MSPPQVRRPRKGIAVDEDHNRRDQLLRASARLFREKGYDGTSVRDIVRESAADNYRFSTLVMQIVMSDAFQKSRVPVEAAGAPVIKQAANQR